MPPQESPDVDVTAVIVNYLVAHAAISAAESVLAQDEDVEVWIVDNSQSQTEANLLQAVLGARCRLLVNEKNVGFGAACNQVYAQTRSEFVFLLNPDAYCLPDALARLLHFLRNHPRAAAAGPRVYFDGARQLILPPLTIPSRWNSLLYMPKERVGGWIAWFYSLCWRAGVIRYWQATGPVSHAGLAGGQILLRRAALEQSGGLFDPRFHLYHEDADLCLRLRGAGFRLYTVPEAVVIHAAGSTAMHRADWKKQLARESGAAFMRKHYGRNRRCVWLRGAYKRLRHGDWQPRIRDASGTRQPPTWSVPPAWRDGWLIEIGVGPYLLPAGGLFGTGSTAQIPATIWSGLHPGTYFARLGPARFSWLPPEVWKWQIEPKQDRSSAS
jgi:GT2 family glycosyltransferase